MEPLSGFEPETYSFTYTFVSKRIYQRVRLYLARVAIICCDLAPLVSRSSVITEITLRS